jgi:hypothetical protein|tara:strand:+ start:1881 stop:2888 length:1008 start_codon:yes stop_codon:yes gene_type:complete
MSEAGTKEAGPRSMSEIENTFGQMLTGTEELPEEDSSQEELPSNDSSDVEQQNAELADDSVVDEPDAVEPDELSDSDAPLYAVTIDGETSEVPLDELISGYQRKATYTQRQQELVKERDDLETRSRELGPERQALRQTYQQYQGVLNQLHEQMQAANKPPNMDWDALERENPVQWLKLKELERQRNGEIQAVQAEQARMQQFVAGENQKKLEERLTVEQGLVLEKIPEWANGDLQAEEQRKLVEFGKAVGYSDNELNTLYDHRALVVLRDAMRYNELTNGDKVAEAKSKIGSAKGGNKTTSRRTRSRQVKAKRAKLKDTGKVDDAAALFADILAE